MDRALLAGQTYRAISHRFGVSEDALSRHRKHQRVAIEKASAAADEKQVAYGDSLLEQVRSIQADLDRLQLDSEQGGDRKTAIIAIKEKLRSIELLARLDGTLESGSRVTVNVTTITPEEAIRLARNVIEFFGPRVGMQPVLTGSVADMEQRQ